MPGDDEHGDAERLHESGVIGDTEIGLGMPPLQDRPLEPLRGLNGTQQVTVDRADDNSIVVDLLDGVDNGQSRHHSRAPGLHSRDDVGDHLLGDQWPRSVVHQDDPDVVGEGQQGAGDGVLPCLATSDDDDLGGEVLTREEIGDLVNGIRRSGDDDDVDGDGDGLMIMVMMMRITILRMAIRATVAAATTTTMTMHTL